MTTLLSLDIVLSDPASAKVHDAARAEFLAHVPPSVKTTVGVLARAFAKAEIAARRDFAERHGEWLKSESLRAY